MIIQIAQFLLGLSLLVILHELGHFIPAKLFKTKVEKFYLFFDWKFSLIRKKIGDTVYGIGWIPLGGYVKIAGMVDESMDTKGLGKDPEPWEFRAKPAWQRLIILCGGVIVNFLLAFVIYAGIMAYYGEDYLPMDELEYGIWVQEEAQMMGLQSGDKILAIGGEPVERYNDLNKELLLSMNQTATIERNGKEVQLLIDPVTIGRVIESKNSFVSPRIPYVVNGFSDDSNAQKAGLAEGDSLISLNGSEMLFFDQYFDSIPKYAGSSILLGFVRNGEEMELEIPVDSGGKIGVAPVTDLERFFDIKNKKYTGLESIPAGWNLAQSRLSDYVRQFSLIFEPETGAAGELGGFLTILKQYPTTWNWQYFWSFTAFLSLMLGFLNILPIPALDGGHVLFTVVEMVSGRKPGIKFLEYAQMVGFFILIALLIIANGNDVIRAFGN